MSQSQSHNDQEREPLDRQILEQSVLDDIAADQPEFQQSQIVEKDTDQNKQTGSIPVFDGDDGWD